MAKQFSVPAAVAPRPRAGRPRGRSVVWNGAELDAMSVPAREQRAVSRTRLEDESPALALLLAAEPDTAPEEV